MRRVTAAAAESVAAIAWNAADSAAAAAAVDRCTRLAN
jgi:hypothetical protein